MLFLARRRLACLAQVIRGPPTAEATGTAGHLINGPATMLKSTLNQGVPPPTGGSLVSRPMNLVSRPIHIARFASFDLRYAVAALIILVGAVVWTPNERGAGAQIGGSVFINEIHYDNSGGDSDEGAEVAGPAGTDLTGWSIELYNGSNSKVYRTIALSGTIPDQLSGYGTLWFGVPTNGLQNGPREGLALVDSSNTVIEFLSYEGSITAADGSALGVTSTDIGVSESGGTTVGHSLQRTGTGTVAGDFTWASPQANTRDAVNTGQTFGTGPSGPSQGDLLINEIMHKPATVEDDAGEWFEIYNRSDSDIDILGWTISDSGSDSHTITLTGVGSTLEVPAGGFLVLGINDDSATNGGITVDYEYDGFGLDDGGDEIILEDGNGVEFDKVEYDGGTNFPSDNGKSMSLDPYYGTTTANAEGASWCAATEQIGSGDYGTPGLANPTCLEVSLISTIQGSGASVTITGRVWVEAIVTSLFTANDTLDGFFLQEEDTDHDRYQSTSEGIFVFCRSVCPAALAIGDAVTVIGPTEEFFGMSQIDAGDGGSVVIDSSGNTLPTASSVSLPASGSTVDEATFENVEGMIVTFPDKLVVSEYFQLARFGQLTLTVEERPYQFTHGSSPSVSGYAAHLRDLATRRIILDDDNNSQNDTTTGTSDEVYPYPEGGLSTTNRFRGGDAITGLTGVMHWSWAGFSGTDAWRIRPIPGLGYTFTSENPRQAAPDEVGGKLKVATFNVLNYFATLDEGPSICGPGGNLGCRGANTAAELTRQRDKIVSAIIATGADVVGLLEIENDATASVEHLVAGLNTVAGSGTYTYIDTGTIGDDAIKVALIYKPTSVTSAGEFTILDSLVDSRFIDTKNRPILIQTFEEAGGSERFTVAIGHLKSKGSACDDVGDPNRNDGQANCSGTRTKAVIALIDYLATDPTDSGDRDVLILGDLNAYANEDPITTLEAAGFSDLAEDFVGADAYSYVFDGQRGYLDYALASSTLLPQVTGFTDWHINSDEVPVFDYNDDIRDPGEATFERESNALTTYASDAFRSSDHDPAIIGLDLGSAAPTRSRASPGDERVILSWNPVQYPTVTGYRYRACTGVGFTTCGGWVSLAGASTMTTTVMGLTNGTIYRFELEAVKPDGESRAAFATATPVRLLAATTVVKDTGPDHPAEFSSCVGAATESNGFEDMVGSFAEEAVNCLAHYGITQGRTETGYAPSELVSRGQMALFLYRAAGPVGIELAEPIESQGFSDTDGLDDGTRTAAVTLAQMGIMPGVDEDRFDPHTPVTRESMAVLVDAFLREAEVGMGGTEIEQVTNTDTVFTDIDKVPVSAYKAIIRVYELGIMQGITQSTFAPAQPLTGAQLAVVTARMMAHTGARPRGLSIQISPDQPDEALVAVRDDQFRPVVDALVDVFSMDANAAFLTNGRCPTGAAPVGGGEVCVIDHEDGITDPYGDLFVDLDLSDDRIVWAWTDAIGKKFAATTTSPVASLATEKIKAADRLVISDDLDDQDKRLRFGNTITFTIQLVDQDGNPIRLEGKNVWLGDDTESANGDSSSRTRVYRTDASGRIQVSFTEEDPDGDTDNKDATLTLRLIGSRFRLVDETTNGCASNVCAVVWSDDDPVPTTLVLSQTVDYHEASDRRSGVAHRVTARLLDQYGDPIGREKVRFASDDAAGVGTSPGNEKRKTTNRLGVATLDFTRDDDDAATETISAWVPGLGGADDVTSNELVHHWVTELADQESAQGELLVVDIANKRLVIGDYSPPRLVYYDSNDHFTSGDGRPISMADFEEYIGQNPGAWLEADAYSDDPDGVSGFRILR